jgi:hypothetical protein
MLCVRRSCYAIYFEEPQAAHQRLSKKRISSSHVFITTYLSVCKAVPISYGATVPNNPSYTHKCVFMCKQIHVFLYISIFWRRLASVIGQQMLFAQYVTTYFSKTCMSVPFLKFHRFRLLSTQKLYRFKFKVHQFVLEHPTSCCHSGISFAYPTIRCADYSGFCRLGHQVLSFLE